ncbi:hypothetical protein A2125_02780 [Candidatus Woesebacteria bacterium GWB1_43_5]|uniref:2'-deoxynucleoside 5'-phosphate N-hydrolase 1 n=1 Tax=Candidatus Woesebacteria bacterium GWB1_43_5 TaxID=1802474 RepID=A0A1F7WSN3_9BACT|nr:MAG: hypothetical protein A2125_02780 [Candidatus Woesebacteria bacterium GWB1_43_5]
MKIYFAGSMVGEQNYFSGMWAIVKKLREQGHDVLTGFVIGLPYMPGYPVSNAWERDIPLLQECDAIVAEVSQPSTGVGIELGVAAVAFGKPALCLRHASLENERLSSLINQGPFEVAHYDENYSGSIEAVLQNFFMGLKTEGMINRETE